MINIIDRLVPESITSGELLRIFRQRENLSLKDLQLITGIAESNLSSIENGKILMTQHYAEIFAMALNIHPSVLLYPNGNFNKSKKLIEIQKRAQKYKKQA